MKAVGMFEFGGPEVLQVVDLPDPQVGPDEVLIRVRAATVNPTDTLSRKGLRFRGEGEVGPPPFVPGMDVAGVVEEIGTEAWTDLRIGEEVVAFVVPVGRRGAYAEKVSVPAQSVVRMPKGASFAEAATLPMNAMTARVALDVLALRPGQSLAVSGATGALGSYAIQLAKADGLMVVADAADADRDLVASKGPDHIVARGGDFGALVRTHFQNGADGAIDGALLNEQMEGAVKDGGTIVTLRMFNRPAERGIVYKPIRSKFYCKRWHMLDRLRQQVEEGVLSLHVAETYPKEQAAEAHRRLEAGGVRGRLVLEF